MREAEFREWLGKRLWKGEPLTKKATDNRVRRSQRAERGLQGLGFPYETLDQLFDDGKWEELLARLATLMNEPECESDPKRTPLEVPYKPLIVWANSALERVPIGADRDPLKHWLFRLITTTFRDPAGVHLRC